MSVDGDDITILVPTFNEVENLPLLVDELLPVAAALDAEVLLVDNASTDGLGALVGDSTQFRYAFIPEKGKSVAIRHGIGIARGSIIVTIDADLQEDPRQIPEMIAALNQGFDCVHGCRVSREDRLFHKVIPSTVFNAAVGLLFFRNFRDINCGLRVCRKAALETIPWFEGAHRLVPLLVARNGGRVLSVPVRHQRRRAVARSTGRRCGSTRACGISSS